MKHNKQHKGITLIALIITIIVLLILAGVSISMLAGNNGIVTKSTTAKTENAKGKATEMIELAGTTVKSKIAIESSSDSSYDATEYNNFLELVNIVRKDLGMSTIDDLGNTENQTEGNWTVEIDRESEDKTITIEYKDSNVEIKKIITINAQNMNLSNEDESVVPQEPEKVYLYNEGDECLDLTGGWIKVNNLRNRLRVWRSF